MIQKLDDKNLIQAAHWLANQDKSLALVLQQYGHPPLWARTPSFATLTHIILEQQVSLASANAAFERLKRSVTDLTPKNFLTLDDDALQGIGFSRQKIKYVRHLALALIEGHLSLEALEGLSDEMVCQNLIQLKGIGQWTADIYLSECLLRPDILPKGDIAMLEAFKVLKGLDARPHHEEFVEMTQHWRPWRSVGSRMLWHFYLCERKK
ncbi:MAG: DNA-3-methyladenine glycosylase 2 family protein [Lewinellaceae bacterium]|nr:DNA-3-methyladenine glycosylase 2 family protein [Lewinellaceae bacterium]